jgi:hypothetical protein
MLVCIDFRSHLPISQIFDVLESAVSRGQDIFFPRFLVKIVVGQHSGNEYLSVKKTIISNVRFMSFGQGIECQNW